MPLLNYLRNMIKVGILGSGNVAFHLTAQLIKNKLVKVVQVYNRNLNKIKYLQSETNITNEFSDFTCNEHSSISG